MIAEGIFKYSDDGKVLLECADKGVTSFVIPDSVTFIGEWAFCDCSPLTWFCEAAEQGYPEAQYKLGEMYETGRLVEQSVTEAMKWYQKAADQGY